MVRQPVAAGRFYPGTERQLSDELEKFIDDSREKIRATGILVPHAGYVYSGAVAGLVYGAIEPADLYIILSPNHTGQGPRYSVSAGSWRTPLGDMETDIDVASRIVSRTELLREDSAAHAYEHSVEVQLPFIQKTSPGAKMVAITVMPGDPGELTRIAESVAACARDFSGDVVIVASSDMTHYESRESASKKDNAALERIRDMDPKGLLATARDMNISMCGVVPTAIMLMASELLGASGTNLLRYTDSGEATGDTDQVVGYAGLIVY
ncbi:MAG: AmmeMemoRadiSam system protein B [Candidatus Omnitrophica bacterium]|nr:AmmeMemoRadiSam system protein B [Candidatus Omnitrophota bacterium]